LAVKDFKIAKARLALPFHLKQELCKRMFFDVCNALKNSTQVDKIFVITSNKNLLNDLPSRFISIFENTPNGLNNAIQVGLQAREFQFDDALLILPSDIPLLSSSDIDSYFEISSGHEKIMIISPSLRKDGTNALLLKPPSILKPVFGPNSFEKHVVRARSVSQLKIHVHPMNNVALDIDTMEDLNTLINSNAPCMTRELVKTGDFSQYIKKN
ncbi:MAG: 2-phospho-L-lactate guanylyltransferase, partial [Candidatus Helarchaeota archaeon]